MLLYADQYDNILFHLLYLHLVSLPQHNDNVAVHLTLQPTMHLHRAELSIRVLFKYSLAGY